MEFYLCRGCTFPMYCPGLLNQRDLLQLLTIHGYGHREDVYLHGGPRWRLRCLFVCYLHTFGYSAIRCWMECSHIHEISCLSGKQKKEKTTFWEEWEPHLNKTHKWLNKCFDLFKMAQLGVCVTSGVIGNSMRILLVLVEALNPRYCPAVSHYALWCLTKILLKPAGSSI